MRRRVEQIPLTLLANGRAVPVQSRRERLRPRNAANGTLRVMPCDTVVAREFIAAHHSRLPNTQTGPWMYAFACELVASSTVIATALWHNPSARTLPQTHVELRRMAVSEAAPHCTASAFLGAMVRALRAVGHRHFISYQDAAVHTGTIYKASGWSVEYVGKWRVRERGYSAARDRDYRTSINGDDADHAPKVRWGVCYGCEACKQERAA